MRTNHRAGAVVLALALAACGGGSSDHATASGAAAAAKDPLYMVESLAGVDGCGLLAQQEIEAAFPGPVPAGLGDHSGNCTWKVGADAGHPGWGPGTVAVGGAPHRPVDHGAASTFTDMHGRLGAAAVDVPGVGRAAYYVGGTGGYQPTVTFRTDKDIVWVQASFQPERPATKDVLVELAAAIARRI